MSGGRTPPRRRPPGGLGLAAQVAIVAAVFGATVGVAELAGAANLGVAFGVGQVVAALTIVLLLLRA